MATTNTATNDFAALSGWRVMSENRAMPGLTKGAERDDAAAEYEAARERDGLPDHLLNALATQRTEERVEGNDASAP